MEISTGTKLESFFLFDQAQNCLNPQKSYMNIFRLLLLNKYGGQSFDFDVLSLVSLHSKGFDNFGCMKNEKNLGTSVLSFDAKPNSGKPITNKVVE